LILVNERTGARGNVKSVLAVIGADVRLADACRIYIAGADQDEALTAIRSFVESVLPGCDEALPLAKEGPGEVRLPRAVAKAGVRWAAGRPACGGVGLGVVVSVAELALPEAAALAGGESAEVEHEKTMRALGAVRKALQGKLARRLAAVEAAVINAHLAMVEDVALHDRLAELVESGCSAGQAVVTAARHFMDQLRASESLYVRERAADVQDVCGQLLDELCGGDRQTGEVRLARESVVVAESLAPRQFLALDRGLLKGLVLGQGGATSHTVILARSFGIPTLTDVREARQCVAADKEVVVDAETGIVVGELTPAVRRYYAREAETIRRRRELVAAYIGRPAVTRDGRRIEVAANVSTAAEVGPAIEQGAEGVGLFRTEMLFLDRESPPSEEEQFAAYAEAARAAKGRPVIIRTMDIGGDKPAAYLGLPAEANPFLGYRGARLYPEHKRLFVQQVRAIVRASAFGSLRLMVPMVAVPEEARWARQRVAEVRAELKAKGAAFDAKMPIGAMIEVPSMAFLLERFGQELDFFSIGTNDLAQYFFAADRDNAKVAGLHNVRHPAFLRLLAKIVEEARRLGKWVGLCGEMGRDEANLPLLVGLGLDEISVAAPDVARIKAAAAKLSGAQCREVLKKAMECGDAAEVEALLGEARRPEASRNLLDRELVELDVDCLDKDEVIRRAVDALYVAGRIEDRWAVEEALWAREGVYSTGLGYGFAIPHCKTDAVEADSIGVLRLRSPVEWGSEDGQAVGMVIVLAIRESKAAGTHMKVLARLARKLMHEEFRAGLKAATNAEDVVAYLGRELELGV
jgi:fructose-specific PTS system IIA-like component